MFEIGKKGTPEAGPRPDVKPSQDGIEPPA